MKAIPLLFRRSKYTKTMYMDLLALLYRLMAKSRQQGMFSLERDIENPKESEIFASYPRILADAVMLDFIVDYLRLIISGNMNTFEIEALMDEEIETHESEAEVPANSLAMGGGFTACLWYRSGGNGGGSRSGFSRSPCSGVGGADCPCHGRNVPRYFTGLWIHFTVSYRFAPEERRNHQDDAVRKNHTAV
ncbi:motility protein A [Salmonella enterica subsp. arizonae]|uniref:Motility protein A n=1 Tax=Salmonella enterica subsp. arizonae TaxID=59203 RepID=A0A3S4HES7_SALER|nr:motility protein A [Salmonella enterica subsp. arizonae]